MTFAEFHRMFREAMARKPKPANVVDMETARQQRDSRRWLIKYTRPMPPKDPPEAA